MSSTAGRAPRTPQRSPTLALPPNAPHSCKTVSESTPRTLAVSALYLMLKNRVQSTLPEEQFFKTITPPHTRP